MAITADEPVSIPGEAIHSFRTKFSPRNYSASQTSDDSLLEDFVMRQSVLTNWHSMDKKKIRSASGQVTEPQQLIAGLLIATIEADSLFPQKYLDYLMKIAFESYDPATGQTGKIHILTFNYRSQDTGGGGKQNVSIPILTLVSLLLLQVQEVDFDFDIEIPDVLSETAEEKLPLGEGKSASEP